MAKMLLVPGWRVGWLCIHDGGHDLTTLRTGILNLSQIILGANTLAQVTIVVGIVDIAPLPRPFFHFSPPPIFFLQFNKCV